MQRLRPLIPYLPGAALVLIEAGLQLSGIQSVPVAIGLWSLAGILLLGAASHHARNWHSGQRVAGRAGLSSFYFIIPCLVIGVIAVAAAAYGFGLRETMTPPTGAAGSGQTETDLYTGKQVPAANPYPQSILTSRYYSKKNKEDVADILDKANDALNKQGKDILSLAEIAINRSPWESPTADLAPMIERVQYIEALTANFQRDMFEVLYRDYPDYRTELDNLFPPHITVGIFQGGARDFQNALTVWSELRNTVDGGPRNQLQQLVGTARSAFGGYRDEFQKWTADLQGRISQTRMALRQ